MKVPRLRKHDLTADEGVRLSVAWGCARAVQQKFFISDAQV